MGKLPGGASLRNSIGVMDLMDVEHSAPIRTVAIIGLGLIGGSLARDLAARGIRILGSDKDFASFRGAFTTGAANDLFEVSPDAPLAAEVVVIAVPVLAAAQVLRSLAPHLDGVRLVTDVGSTKGSIVRAAEELGIGARFVGSHPLAGDHRSGWDASRAGLFDGARVFLTPAASTGDDALHLARELWTMVDARPEVMDADEHDARLAWTSHLPQAVSTALALSLDRSGIPRSELGPGGRDVTRLAGSNPDVWIDILLDNADALASALAAMAASLSGVQRAVISGDRDELRRLLTQARTWHGVDP
jgi:prephenate dehydrogenase